MVTSITERLSPRLGPPSSAGAPRCRPWRAIWLAGGGLSWARRTRTGPARWPCARGSATGRRPCCKLSPDPPFLAGQAQALRLFAPGGRVPAVLAADAGAGAVLLEAVEPGTGADELPDPPTAADWGALIRALHCAAAPPRYPRDLRGRCDEFFARIGLRLAEPRIAARLRPADLDRGAERYGRLLATVPALVLLHGDLHLGNVLDGGPARGLVAIDPRACAGDPCFDAVDYVLDGAGRDGVAARCDALAAAAGLAPGRLHAWSRAIAPIIAISRIGQPGRERAVEELLALSR